MIFDGECGFCRRSVVRIRRLTGGEVEFLAQQSPDCAARFPFLDPRRLAESVYLVEPGGRVSHGAEAVMRALAVGGRHPGGQWAYERVPGLAGVLEWGYRRVARNRPFFSWLTRPFAGDDRV